MTRLIKRSSPEGKVKSGRTPPGNTLAGPADVLDFWFGPAPLQVRNAWFSKDDAFDALIAQRFGTTLQAAAEGRCDHWASNAAGALALIILLDQFPRNLHRGSAAAFACDAKARTVANAAIDAGWAAQLAPLQQLFVYLPFEHSEQLADQQHAVALMATWQDDPALAGFHRYAVLHHDVIARFGRFPHRNAVLERSNTPEESAYLAQPGSGF